MSKFPLVVQAVYDGLDLHEMVFLRECLDKRISEADTASRDAVSSDVAANASHEVAEQAKPAPIVLKVDGAEHAGFGLIGGDGGGAEYDWDNIISLPPFEMFVKEKYPNFPNPRSFVTATVRSPDTEKAVIAEYSRWFEEKGLWANESPLGGLKDVQ
jgi:hypothetical protein|nr:MAG TPA: hypothetical protein [Caudoviricetes sp.]